MSDTKIPKFAERTYDGITKRYDVPRDQLLEQVERIRKHSKWKKTFYYKFTCHHCKARLLFGTPDILYEVGICPDCRKETHIKEAGFMEVTEYAKPTKQPLLEGLENNENDQSESP